MSRPAIEVAGLGKRYVIEHESRHDNLRDTLHHTARKLWRRFRWGTSFSREEFWALRGVKFTVQPGEVVGIIGRNGAGKSTLLKILARITEPTTGSVRVRGRVASLLEVGTGFHPELSGRENIYLNGAILGMSRAEIHRKFDDIVAFAETERFLDTPVKHYSSGMYVRLAFAVAAHLDPEILIVDEVLAVGDADFQAKCLGKMETIAATTGRTVLFVSHNMTAVARFCHRTLVLEQGAVVIDGRTDVAIDRYLNSGPAASGAITDLSQRGVVEGSPIRMQTLKLNDGGSVTNRRPLVVTLRFVADRPVAAVGFGLGVCGLDGRRILTFESDHDGDFFRVNEAGEMTAQMQLPSVDLIPGRYRIDIGAFSQRHLAFHYVGDCATIDVLPCRETPGHLHGVYGDCRPRTAWQLLPK